jgi:heme exporter protein B
MSFWRKVITITWKDTLSEMRTKEIIFSVLVFTILVIVIFNFAFGANQETIVLVAPGILWTTFTFAGVLSLNRAFIPENKMLGSLLFLLIIEVIALVILAFLFNLAVFSLQIVVITLLTTIGFVAVGTLFSALAVNTKAREMVLPILFLPIVIPIIISAVKASGLALSGESWGDLSSWLQIIAAFDAVFLVASFFIFTFVIEE